MVCCDTCERWVHIACDGMATDTVEKLETNECASESFVRPWLASI